MPVQLVYGFDWHSLHEEEWVYYDDYDVYVYEFVPAFRGGVVSFDFFAEAFLWFKWHLRRQHRDPWPLYVSFCFGVGWKGRFAILASLYQSFS